MKPTMIALALVGLAVVAGAVGYVVAPTRSTDPSPAATVTFTPSPEGTRFAESDYFPYADAGWQTFFGQSDGRAVVQTSETTLEYVDCRDLRLPMFEGRVNDDAVEYYLHPDDRIVQWVYHSAGPGPVSGWIAYRDSRCMRRLTSAIRTFIEDALAEYRRSGIINGGHPDGP